jgi:hypothetical protein
MKEVGPWHAWKILSNQTKPSGCQVNIKCFYAKSTCLGSNYRNIISLILVQKVIFQDICRELWIIIAELTCGLFPMIFRMVFPSCLHSNTTNKTQLEYQIQSYLLF